MTDDPTTPEQVSYTLVIRLLRRIAHLVPSEHKNELYRLVGEFGVQARIAAGTIESDLAKEE